jgi:hypothetical protein
MHDECYEKPAKNGGSTSRTSGQTTVKPERKPTKNAFFPAKREKNTRKHS